MGHKLPPDQMQLYRRVDEVLHYIRDPIGISDTPEVRDEYQSYLPHVFSLLVRGAPSDEVAAFLVTTATETMGLSGRRHHEEHAKEVAEVLERWRDITLDRSSTA